MSFYLLSIEHQKQQRFQSVKHGSSTLSEHKQAWEACSPPPRLLLTPRLPSARVSSQIHFWIRGKLFGKALSFFITRTHRVHLCLFRRDVTSHPDMFIIKNITS